MEGQLPLGLTEIAQGGKVFNWCLPGVWQVLPKSKSFYLNFLKKIYKIKRI